MLIVRPDAQTRRLAWLAADSIKMSVIELLPVSDIDSIQHTRRACIYARSTATTGAPHLICLARFPQVYCEPLYCSSHPPLRQHSPIPTPSLPQTEGCLGCHGVQAVLVCTTLKSPRLHHGGQLLGNPRGLSHHVSLGVVSAGISQAWLQPMHEWLGECLGCTSAGMPARLPQACHQCGAAQRWQTPIGYPR